MESLSRKDAKAQRRKEFCSLPASMGAVSKSRASSVPSFAALRLCVRPVSYLWSPGRSATAGWDKLAQLFGGPSQSAQCAGKALRSPLVGDAPGQLHEFT